MRNIELSELFTTACLALTTVIISVTPVDAQNLEKCRPRTNNWLQRVTQKMAYPNTPLCRPKQKPTLKNMFPNAVKS
jgi:hypothetical protein